MKTNNAKRYDVLILLCPSDPKIIDGNYTYFDLDKDKEEDKEIYLGGKVRMEAAAKLAKNTATIIVVGGSKSKVDGMRNYLKQELKNKKLPVIIRIESDPDTLGNLRAIKNQKINFEGKSVAILTNQYHLPRTLKFAQSIFPENSFIPIPAELVIFGTDLVYKDAFLLREQRETKGLKDWEDGIYRNQNKQESECKSICYDQI